MPHLKVGDTEMRARSPMQSSSYYRAKDTITLRRIQPQVTKRFESLSDRHRWSIL
jgi:hypothetical protein